VLCAVVLTSPVLAMATYTASSRPPALPMCVTQTVLCAVVLTSPVLAMATYTASEPPTCATNVDAVWTKGYFLTIIRKIRVKFIFKSPQQFQFIAHLRYFLAGKRVLATPFQRSPLY
jgi:hypothetical protein